MTKITLFGSLLLRVLFQTAGLLAFSTASPLLATTYYVRSGGNNQADGLSDATAWATVDRVNRQNLEPGDQVLFRRGDTWRETVIPQNGSASSKTFIYYGAYGTGDKPRISGADVISNWIDSNGDGTFEAAVPHAVYIVAVDSALSKKGAGATALQDGQWFYASNVLYYKGSPTGKTIQAGQRQCAFVARDSAYYAIDGFHVELTNGEAIYVKGAFKRPVIIKNNYIRWAESFDPQYIGGQAGQAGGIRVSNTFDGQILDNVIEDVFGEGLFVYDSKRILIKGNRITGVRLGVNNGPDGIQIIGNFDGNMDDFKVINNYVSMTGTNTGKGCLQMEGANNGIISGNTFIAGSFGTGVDGNGLLIEKNTFHQQGTTFTAVWTSSIRIGGSLQRGGTTLSNNVIRHNVIYNNVNHGINIVGTAEKQNFKVYNNTIYSVGDGFGVEEGGNYTRLSGNFLNNIIWTGPNNPGGNSGDQGRAHIYGVSETFAGSWKSNYNIIGQETAKYAYYRLGSTGTLYATLAAFRSATGKDVNSKAQDPQFVNAAGADFTLTSGSPAVDAGTFLTYATLPGANATTLKVADARYFSDGRGVVPGDTIRIGRTAAPVVVTRVNYDEQTLTLAEARTWVERDPVSPHYQGNAPDAGAAESPFSGPTNFPPTAVIQTTPVGKSLQVAYDGSGSFDQDGAIATYTWNFGNGQTATGPTATFTYPKTGTYEVSLTVTNADGAADQVTKSILIFPEDANYTLASADAFTRAGDADKNDNFGFEESVAVRKQLNNGVPNKEYREGYVQWNVAASGLDTTQKAYVRLHAVPGTTAPVHATYVVTGAWGEKTITYANAPAAEALPFRSYVFPEKFVDIEVTSQLRQALRSGQATFSIKIATSADVYTAYLSKDNKERGHLGPYLFTTNAEIVSEVIGTEEIWVEAECVDAGAKWLKGTSTAASGQQYISTPDYGITNNTPDDPATWMSYSFVPKESGKYRVWARVLVPGSSASKDSFYGRLAGPESTTVWARWNNLNAASKNNLWGWDDLHNNDTGGAP